MNATTTTPARPGRRLLTPARRASAVQYAKAGSRDLLFLTVGYWLGNPRNDPTWDMCGRWQIPVWRLPDGGRTRKARRALAAWSAAEGQP
jgi:hypothetical protein